jgi:hypothetical protein
MLHPGTTANLDLCVDATKEGQLTVRRVADKAKAASFVVARALEVSMHYFLFIHDGIIQNQKAGRMCWTCLMCE